jgi:DNA-binding XRE family transcriptional regulator
VIHSGFETTVTPIVSFVKVAADIRSSQAPLWRLGILNTIKNVSVPVAATPNTGEGVGHLRAARGVSVRGLAARVGVSPATISAIENGETGISVQQLHQIATALAVPAAALVEDPAAPTQPRNAGPSSVELATGNWRDSAPLPIGPVLAGAIKAFVDTGYHGASMRSIAQFANMSVPGVYHHHPSKQDLLVKNLDITMIDLLWRLQRARDGNNPIERVALVVEALALFHTTRSDLSFIGASEMRSPRTPSLPPDIQAPRRCPGPTGHGGCSGHYGGWSRCQLSARCGEGDSDNVHGASAVGSTRRTCHSGADRQGIRTVCTAPSGIRRYAPASIPCSGSGTPGWGRRRVVRSGRPGQVAGVPVPGRAEGRKPACTSGTVPGWSFRPLRRSSLPRPRMPASVGPPCCPRPAAAQPMHTEAPTVGGERRS